MSTVTPYKDQTSSKKEQVKNMFDAIAPKYDFLNQLLSLGIHKIWRKKAIRLLQPEHPKIILDIATGTADFAIEAIKLNPAKITGVDISPGMLKLGSEKINKLSLQQRIELKLADSESLPFADNSFDAVTAGFGVRNFEHLEAGVKDMCRVLKPGGTMVILEFSKPRKFPVKQVYTFYFKYITPFVGKMFSKDRSAYRYLPASVNAFPDGEDFLNVLKKSGLKETRAILLTFGIASIYIAKK